MSDDYPGSIFRAGHRRGTIPAPTEAELAIDLADRHRWLEEFIRSNGGGVYADEFIALRRAIAAEAERNALEAKVRKLELALEGWHA